MPYMALKKKSYHSYTWDHLILKKNILIWWAQRELTYSKGAKLLFGLLNSESMVWVLSPKSLHSKPTVSVIFWIGRRIPLIQAYSLNAQLEINKLQYKLKTWKQYCLSLNKWIATLNTNVRDVNNREAGGRRGTQIDVSCCNAVPTNDLCYSNSTITVPRGIRI